MLHPAYKIVSSEEIFIKETNRLKQLFTNNNYPMDFIENCITAFINKKKNSNNHQLPCLDKIKIFYGNQMSERYKIDEKVMKDIIK